MFSPNEIAMMVLAGFSLVFITLMYIIISNAIDGRDKGLKRLEKRENRRIIK